MPRYKINKGQIYGFLLALDEPKNEKGHHPFKCKRCGTKCYKVARVVAAGHTKSCGCMPRGGESESKPVQAESEHHAHYILA